MKKLLAAAALTLGAAMSAHAADANGFRFLVGAGLTFGGDTLITVPFTDGSHEDIKAGGLVHLYGGGEFRLGDQVALQATIGYHVNDTSAASNGSVRFTRIPVDLLAMYQLNDTVRLGVGAQFVSGAELKGSGVASNINAKFDSTTGVILEGEYLFSPKAGVKLRYVAEKFKPQNSSTKIDGSQLGLMASYYF
ncbi:outer membrane beta-barrel protein [Piscinibacter terrae]|nr:outer membrane beta-barrel protein [Albitalea terrae]